MNTLSDIAKQLGKRGGETTKQRHPDHFKEISKKGVEARRKKKQVHDKENNQA